MRSRLFPGHDILEFLVPKSRKTCINRYKTVRARPLPKSSIQILCRSYTSTPSRRQSQGHILQSTLPIRAHKASRESQIGKADTTKDLEDAFRQGEAVLSSNDVIPSEETIRGILQCLEHFSIDLVGGKEHVKDKRINEETTSPPLNTILSLSEGTNTPTNYKPKRLQISAEAISELAFNLIRHPNVFISSDVLKKYVEIQSLLGRHEYIPPALSLFADKPIPITNSSPIRYSKPWTSVPKYAVPQETADMALESAIEAKDLSAALAVIDTTYAKLAFRRKKILTKASLPAAGFALTPVAAYLASTQLTAMSPIASSQLSPEVAFAGIMAYVSFTAAIGFVAVTTANHQMLRVTWAVGTPLRQRWMREEERAAYDKVAVAWGFGQERRWGEEEGEEWTLLREIIGRRSMVLDRTELMEGME